MKLTPENYHSKEANQHYLSVSQYKEFVGMLGRPACEAKALAKFNGVWIEEPSTAMLVGSYVDAFYEGTLEAFVAANPQIMTKSGELKAEFKRARDVIARIERDEYFKTLMSGEKQVIMTAELFGQPWKVKIDSYHAGRAIVDLKVMASLTQFFWVKDYGKMNFIEYWGYDIQGSIYQEVSRIFTGDTVPFVIAGASKEEYPDIEVIGFDQQRFNDILREVEQNVPRIIELKSGQVEPVRCGQCDYCRDTKVLSRAIHYTELRERV